MLHLAEWLVRFLVPFLVTGTAVLSTVFLYLLLQRAVRALLARRRLQLESRYAGTIRAFVTGSSARDSLLVLRTAPRRHRRLLAELLSRPLRVAAASWPMASARARRQPV